MILYKEIFKSYNQSMKAIQFLALFILSFSMHAAECDLKSPRMVFHPRFAKHFRIEYFKNFKIVHSGKDQYLLSNSTNLGCETSIKKIITPARRVAMMSTTYLPALELIQMEKSLIGFQGKQYIVSQAFDLNKVQEISYKFNTENLLNLKADLIMGYDSNLSSAKQVDVFKSLNIPVVINRDFEEVTPLGRAEWLIFIASFYDQEEKAKKVFNFIGSEYMALKYRNSKYPPKTKPKVLVGEIQNGRWVTCGGLSDLAQMISDAGGELLLSKPSLATQQISLEELSLQKTPVDFWLTHNTWASHDDLTSATTKNSQYLLIKAKNIYNNNLIRNKNNSNDYWETGMQRPDLILRDLSVLFNPKEYKDHKTHWYQKL